jgi:hypothetical protein
MSPVSCWKTNRIHHVTNTIPSCRYATGRLENARWETDLIQSNLSAASIALSSFNRGGGELHLINLFPGKYIFPWLFGWLIRILGGSNLWETWYNAFPFFLRICIPDIKQCLCWVWNFDVFAPFSFGFINSLVMSSLVFIQNNNLRNFNLFWH